MIIWPNLMPMYEQQDYPRMIINHLRNQNSVTQIRKLKHSTTWRFEALEPFLNACKTLQIIDVYINAETQETSMWAALVVDNKVNLYKEWLNDRFGIHSQSKEFIRKENQ